MARCARGSFETTPGRMKIGELLPQRPGISYDLCNKLHDEARDLEDDRCRLPPLRPEGIGDLLRPHHGSRLLQRLSRRAFPSARTTWSFRRTKEKLVNETRDLAKEYEQQYIDGLITQGEKYNKIVDAWAKCTDRVAEEMMKKISAVRDR